MHGEVKGIDANDVPNWRNWIPTSSHDEFQWFTVGIGPIGSPGADNFQVAVSTPLGLRDRRDKEKFVGLVVDRFEPQLVEKAICDFVNQCEALTWDGVVELLQSRMRWEFEGYRG